MAPMAPTNNKKRPLPAVVKQTIRVSEPKGVKSYCE
ncbi:hypothetical protein A2U01_0102575, partial [Trifolium medium]|nr:hypothetical protein [Trifolium medium]